MSIKMVRIITGSVILACVLITLNVFVYTRFSHDSKVDSEGLCYAQEDSTGCIDSEAAIVGVRDNVRATVKSTKAYLKAHPRADDLELKLDPIWDYGENYIEYIPGSDWKAWYVVGQFGGAETDGAYYYDSVRNTFAVCGKRYLKYDWDVLSEYQTTLCPPALGWLVDKEALDAN